MFDWEKAFSNTSVDENSEIFNRTILNILNKFVPHEAIVCNDRDLPWFNDKISLLFKEKTIFVIRVTMLIGYIVWKFSKTV